MPAARRHARARDPARRLPPRDGQRSTWNTGDGDTTLKQVALDEQPLRRPRPAHHEVRPAATPTTSSTPATPPRSRRPRRRPPPCAGTPTAPPTAPATPPAARRPGRPRGSSARRRRPSTRRRSGAWPAQYDTATTVLDGTYTATAQAFDDRGIAGDSRAAVLPLNRSRRSPSRASGRPQLQPETGSSSSWNANPELRHHRLRGLRLGPRRASTTATTARVRDRQRGRHELPGSARCRRRNPTYCVVALDRTTSRTRARGTRESPYAQVGHDDARPSPARPPGCSSSPDLATGKPKLTWSHPNTATSATSASTATAAATPADRYNITTTQRDDVGRPRRAPAARTATG